MKLEYTREELSAQVAALEQLFDTVQIVDPYRGVLLDTATMEPCGESSPIPMLDESGRGMQLGQVNGNGRDEVRLYQSIQVDGRPCVLVLYYPVPQDSSASAGARNSYDRALAQYREDMRRDYVTGAYNSRYIQEEYRSYAEKQAMQGQPVGAVMLRVNEYWNLRNQESVQAAECCLNTAAGIFAAGGGHRPRPRGAGPVGGWPVCSHHGRHAGSTTEKIPRRCVGIFAQGLQHHAGTAGNLHGVYGQRRMGRDFLLGNDARSGTAAAVIFA